MADITFSAPHRTFFALHQQLPVSAANYYRNAFLYSFFKCIFVAIFYQKTLTLCYLYLSLCFVKAPGHLSFFQVSVKMRYIFSNITKVTFVFSALCYFDKIHLQFIENMLK